MIKWRFYFTFKYEGPHRNAPDKQPIRDIMEKYPELKWIDWCDPHYADCYIDFDGYSEKEAWERFKHTAWVLEMIESGILEKIEMEPKLCRITIYPKERVNEN